MIVENFLEATFSLTGEDEVKCIEGVKVFKYLGNLQNRSDNDWKAVLQNIRKAQKVWGRLGKMLWREWAEPTVSEKFYHVVIQAVLLFGTYTWVMLAPM